MLKRGDGKEIFRHRLPTVYLRYTVEFLATSRTMVQCFYVWAVDLFTALHVNEGSHAHIHASVACQQLINRLINSVGFKCIIRKEMLSTHF